MAKHSVKFILALFLVAAACVVLCVCWFGQSQMLLCKPVSISGVLTNKTVSFDRTLVENLKLYQTNSPFPRIVLGACRVARPRHGGFRLGIGNVLELNHLEINIPIDTLAVPAAATNLCAQAGSPLSVDASSVTDVLNNTLDIQHMRSMANLPDMGTTLTINDLRIYFLHGKERFAVLAARSARPNDKGLTLRGVTFLTEDLRQMETSRASLDNQNGWRITENKQFVQLEQVAVAIRKLTPCPMSTPSSSKKSALSEIWNPTIAE